MAELIPLLMHLPPPMGFSPIVLTRSSVYFDDSHDYGIEVSAPEVTVDPVLELAREFGAGNATLRDLCLSFPAKYSRVDPAVIRQVREVTQAWIDGYPRKAGSLWYERGPDFLRMHDGRLGEDSVEVLEAPLDSIYLACEDGATIDEVLSALPPWRSEERRVGKECR